MHNCGPKRQPQPKCGSSFVHSRRELVFVNQRIEDKRRSQLSSAHQLTVKVYLCSPMHLHARDNVHHITWQVV
jgi:hypothetical protein